MSEPGRERPRLAGLRIVIVSPFATDSARGNATTASRLARRLATLGASAEVVCASDGRSLREALGHGEVHALIGIHAGHFSRALAEAGIELHPKSGPLPALLLTIGGNELYEDLGIAPDADTPGHLRPASWALFERADAVLVATEHQRTAALERRAGGVFLVHRYPEVGFGPVTVSGGGSLAEALEPSTGPTLAWCGALRPQKRPEWILPIFEAVQRQHPGARLLLAGPAPTDGPGQALEAQLVATPGILRIAPFAAGPRGSIGTLLAHTDLTLNTSRTEGMSNFLLESMRESVPVLAADSRGTASWVTDQGRLFRDLEAGTAAAVELLADPAAAQALGARGRAWVESWASPEREAEALAEAVLAACRA